MAGDHEQAWAEALAQEHTHQRELLATLRGELGTFARECAATLTALESYGVDLAGLGTAADTAKEGYQNVTLVLDVGRRVPALAPTTAPHDDELVGLYSSLGDNGDVPPALVRHAGELARTAPRRTDRELLKAVVDAAGVRSRLEELVGPAPVAALAACKPLARWVPALSTAGSADTRAPAGRDLDGVLESTAALGTAAGEAVGAEATELAGSLRDTVEHLRGAARAVEEGRLEQVLAEARRRLEQDLDRLRGVVDSAPDAAWQAARRGEHAALTEEVREKLERIERIRRALGLLLPRLQLGTRALSTVEKVRAVENRLDPAAAAGVEAARMSLLLGLADLWEAILPGARTAAVRSATRSRMRWLVAAAALVLAGAVVAVVLTRGGGSNEERLVASTPAPVSTAVPTTTTAATVPVAAVPPAPKVSPVSAVFDPEARATFYSIAVRANKQGTPAYAWRLAPPKNDPSCNKFEPVAGSPERAAWHHADTDSCAHIGLQHDGTVTVTVTTTAWECTATFFGTLTKTGPAAHRCRRVS